MELYQRNYLLVLWISISRLHTPGNAITENKSERIEKIGNSILASFSGVDVPGTIFLLNDVILKEGVVFAFTAFFRSEKPISFQIWRPINGGVTSGFRLIWEMPVIPSLVGQAEIVYVRGKLIKDCTRVHSGDRLGVALIDSPGAVAYTFDASTASALGYVPIDTNNHTVITNGGVVYFGSLFFPYIFSMAAYIDTDLSQYASSSDLVRCPNLTVSEDIGTDVLSSIPPTQGEIGPAGASGPPGRTGATGPRGKPGAAGPPGRTPDVSAVNESAISGRSVGIFYLIWLLILTILFILLSCYLCCRYRRRTHPPATSRDVVVAVGGGEGEKTRSALGIDNNAFVDADAVDGGRYVAAGQLRPRKAVQLQRGRVLVGRGFADKLQKRSKKNVRISEPRPPEHEVFGFHHIPTVSGVPEVNCNDTLEPARRRDSEEFSQSMASTPIGALSMGHYKVFEDLSTAVELGDCLPASGDDYPRPAVRRHHSVHHSNDNRNEQDKNNNLAQVDSSRREIQYLTKDTSSDTSQASSSTSGQFMFDQSTPSNHEQTVDYIHPGQPLQPARDATSQPVLTSHPAERDGDADVPSSPSDDMGYYEPTSWLDQLKPEDTHEYSIDMVSTEDVSLPCRPFGVDLLEEHFRKVREEGVREREIV